MPRVPKTNSQENISETNGEWHKPSTQKYVKYNFVKPYMWQIANNASTHKHESTQALISFHNPNYKSENYPNYKSENWNRQSHSTVEKKTKGCKQLRPTKG